MKTLLFTGGGTGGHIFPALAVAQELQMRRPDVQLQFVGAQGGMEVQLVQQAGYTIHTLTIQGLQRRLSLSNFKKNLALPFKLFGAVATARKLLRQLKPAAVLGTGGYVSLPLLVAAAMAGVPFLINEQNAKPGLVNRLMAPYARQVLLGNAQAATYLPKHNVRYTGNPVRPDLKLGDVERARLAFNLTPAQPVVLVIGGSLGARTLNNALLSGLDALQGAGIQLLWQCGKAYYDALLTQVAGKVRVRLMPFIHNMADAYAVAQLVVCRAGALTISELIELSKPAVIVPSPNVTADHQTANARSLSNRGAALLIPDAAANAQLVPTLLRLLVHAPQELATLQEAIAGIEKPHAAQTITEALLAYLPTT